MRTGLLVLAFTISSIATALAGPYGAFATEPSGAIGWSKNYDTAEEAAQRAKSECQAYGATCSVVTTFRDTCAAFADTRNNDGIYSYAINRLLETAMDDAVKACDSKAGGASCGITMWACTGTESGKH